MIAEPTQAFDILLVEDEPADAHLVRLGFKENRVLCNIHHVLDGAEALAFLKQQPPYLQAPRPDLILLDLNMPRMNGKEFLIAIKALPDFTSIPVVVLTTSGVERDVVASYQLGAAGYITKPVDMEQFISAIRQIDGYWFTVVRLPQKD